LQSSPHSGHGASSAHSTRHPSGRASIRFATTRTSTASRARIGSIVSWKLLDRTSGLNLDVRWVWPFRNPGMGHIFLNANRNKRSVVLDLKKAPAREACLALAKRADVLVYNIRPQAMARLRLSYEDVKAVNPKIIYVGCFGYSQRGPYAAKAAYDDLIQGAAGVPWLLKKQGADSPRFAPIIIADRSVGQQVASAVSAALYYRE